MDDRETTGTPPLRLHPRLLIGAALCSIVMLPVGVLLASIGVLILRASGGADVQTGTVVLIAAFAVTDFWGGGLTWMLTKAPRREVMVSWGIVRLPLLVLAAVASTRMILLAPVMLAVALPAAWLGARMAATQHRLREDARREQDLGAERAGVAVSGR